MARKHDTPEGKLNRLEQPLASIKCPMCGKIHVPLHVLLHALQEADPTLYRRVMEEGPIIMRRGQDGTPLLHRDGTIPTPRMNPELVRFGKLYLARLQCGDAPTNPGEGLCPECFGRTLRKASHGGSSARIRGQPHSQIREVGSHEGMPIRPITPPGVIGTGSALEWSPKKLKRP